MFLRGGTYKGSGNGSSQVRPNIPKFLFKVKKGDQFQYNPPLRTIDLTKQGAVPHFPKRTRAQQNSAGIIKRWGLKPSFRKPRSPSQSGPKACRRRGSLQRPRSHHPGEWSAVDEHPEDPVLQQVKVHRARKLVKLGSQRSLPLSISQQRFRAEEEGDQQPTSLRTVQSLRLKPVRRPSWRLSLQDAITGNNRASVYLQDTASPQYDSPTCELRALKRSLSEARFYKDNSALKFLFPDTEEPREGTMGLGSLIRRVSSRKSKLERAESRRLKKWRKRFLGVNKKFVMKHLVSF